MQSRVKLDVDYYNQPELVLEVYRNNDDIRDKSLNKFIDELEYGDYEKRHILINKDFFNTDKVCEEESLTKNQNYRGTYTFIPLSREDKNDFEMYFENVKRKINRKDTLSDSEDAELNINENPPCVDCGSDPINGRSITLTTKGHGNLTVANDVIIGGKSMKETFDKIDELEKVLEKQDVSSFVPYRQYDENGLNDVKGRVLHSLSTIESIIKINEKELDQRLSSLLIESIDRVKDFINKI